nr:hypothetical protein [Myxococcus sp. SDU36]
MWRPCARVRGGAGGAALGVARAPGGARTPLPPDLRARARGLLNVFIAHHLGRRLKSVDFMAQVGLD